MLCFQLIAATNPCPCGYSGDRLVACRCTERATERYRRRLSGPLLDRFDMHIRVPRVPADELVGPGGEASETVRNLVVTARKRQLARGRINRLLDRTRLDVLAWHTDATQALRDAVAGLGLTARGWDRVRRVAVTIADLAESEVITASHVLEALAYRGGS